MDTAVTDILSKAGWFEGRKSDISDYMQWFADEGYDPPLRIVDFLHEFGGLELHIPFHRKHHVERFFHTVLFDPEENGFEFEFINKYNDFLNVSLYPIGVSSVVPDVFMDQNGGFYLMYGDIGTKCGDSLEEFVTIIMNNKVPWLDRAY